MERVRVLDSIRKRKINLAQEDLKLEVRRKQQTIAIETTDYTFVATECQGTPEFKAALPFLKG